ncbi:MAG: hypothetical protein RLY58_305 [Pseudomonadota bacterium]|jgi:DNA-binding transcriptional MerR regulator
MKIGDLAKHSGFSRDTIRFYERLGLLGTATRPQHSNNYKDYSAMALRRLGLIAQAKRLGFTLTEIGDLIQVWDNQQLSVTDKTRCIQQKIGEIEAKQHDLAILLEVLTETLAKVQTGCTDAAPALSPT